MHRVSRRSPDNQLANLQLLKPQIDIESKEEINQLIIGNLIGRLENLEVLELGLPVASAIDASALFKHGGGKLRRLDLLSSFPSAFEMKKICQYCPQLADVDFWLCHERALSGKFSRETSTRSLRLTFLTWVRVMIAF